MDEHRCNSLEPLCCRTLSSSCAVGTGIMKDPSRSGVAVALLVALHALCSVELTGKFRALPDARTILTIKFTLVATLSTCMPTITCLVAACNMRCLHLPHGRVVREIFCMRALNKGASEREGAAQNSDGKSCCGVFRRASPQSHLRRSGHLRNCRDRSCSPGAIS